MPFPAAVSARVHRTPVLSWAGPGGNLIIGVPFDQPGPIERTLDGRSIGFDLDVANRLGMRPSLLTWDKTTRDNRETDLTSGSVDLVAAYAVAESSRLDGRRPGSTAARSVKGRFAQGLRLVTTNDVILAGYLTRYPELLGPSGSPLPEPPTVMKR